MKYNKNKMKLYLKNTLLQKGIYLNALEIFFFSLVFVLTSCQQTKKENDSGSDADVDTDTDTTIDLSNTEISPTTNTTDDSLIYFQHTQQILGDTIYDRQDIIKMKSISYCEENRRLEIKEGISPFITLFIYYHENHALVGTHAPFISTTAHDDEGELLQASLNEGFQAGYSADVFDDNGNMHEDHIWAESGTVQVFEEGERYRIVYDLPFSDDIHEKGEWLVEQCGESTKEL